MSSIWSTRGHCGVHLHNWQRRQSIAAPLLSQFKVRLGVAERADIVVDFTRFPLGTELYLVNRLEQPDNRGPTKVQAPGTRVLKFKVDRNPRPT